MQFVRTTLDEYFGTITPEGWIEVGGQALAATIVNNVMEWLRPVVEADLRGKMISTDECHEQELRMSNAAIADYCRHRRLALERAADVVMLSTSTWSALLILLALDEAHYARLAERPLKRDEPIGQLG